MSITPIMCMKCGGCPAYGNLLLCLFCEDGEPCKCGGWNTEYRVPSTKLRAKPKSVPATRNSALGTRNSRRLRASVVKAAAPEVRTTALRGHDFCERCHRRKHRGKCIGASRDPDLRADLGLETARLERVRAAAAR